MKYKISAVKCENYNENEVYLSLKSSIDNLGGINKFIKKGQKVLLKPNLLRGASTEEAITTHPSVLKAMANLVKEIGGQPLIAESPGAGITYSESSLKDVYEKCGLTDIFEKKELNYDIGIKDISYPKARLLKKFEIIKPAIEADVIINMPKIKTHSFTYLTCAVKNIFGLIPGRTKIVYHGTLKDPDNFSRMLLDISDFIKPHLTIVDGIVGMDGDGPAAGNPKKIGLILAGENILAMDFAICKLINMKPEKVSYLRIAQQEGNCPKLIDEIDILGDNFIKSMTIDFKLPSTYYGKEEISGIRPYLKDIALSVFNELLTVKPKVMKKMCKSCGICIKNCPVSAMKNNGNKIMIDYDKCIRCYCCHELCPEKSIKLKRNFLNKILIK